MKPTSIRNSGRYGLNENEANIIAECVCRFTGYLLDDIRKRSRIQPLAVTRQILASLLIHVLHANSRSAGAFVGLTHGAVLHGLKHVDDLVATDQKFCEELHELKAMCQDALAKSRRPIK